MAAWQPGRGWDGGRCGKKLLQSVDTRQDSSVSHRGRLLRHGQDLSSRRKELDSKGTEGSGLGALEPQGAGGAGRGGRGAREGGGLPERETLSGAWGEARLGRGQAGGLGGSRAGGRRGSSRSEAKASGRPMDRGAGDQRPSSDSR